MNYQALLFCPDDKTARVVTQVLTELEFSVELSNEPFATVKKLIAKQYDAVVVDCDNEQNAALLFKSARNSTSNQTSLAVAVVEGQAGVAKAFRIGANLVLTKPVNVEQSKGTLRVARGLLKKAEAAKPASGKTAAPQPVVAASPIAPSPISPNSYAARVSLSGAKAVPSASAAKFAATLSANPPVLAADPSTSSFEIDQDPTPALEATETAFLQSIPQPTPSRTSTQSAGSTASKESPWLQLPRSPGQGSETSDAHGAEAPSTYSVAAESVTPLAAPTRVRHPFNTGLPSTHGAAAAAPAREVVLPQTPKQPASDKVLEDLASLSAIAAANDAPNRSRKSLVAALIVIAIAAAGYIERDKFLTLLHPTPVANVPAAPPVAPPATAQVAATPEAQSAGAQAQPSAPVPQLNENQSSDSRHATSPGAKPSSDDIVVVENSAPDPANDVKVVPIKKTSAHLEKPPSAPVQQPVSPPSLQTSSESQDQTIAHLITTTPLTVPHRAPELLKVSQGITQGMLVKKVKPLYPTGALQQRREGTVEIVANIAKNGSISSAKVIKGDPMLALAALTAVKQWKYKPYTLDGQAVDVQTQISVNFKLP